MLNLTESWKFNYKISVKFVFFYAYPQTDEHTDGYTWFVFENDEKCLVKMGT